MHLREDRSPPSYRVGCSTEPTCAGSLEDPIFTQEPQSPVLDPRPMACAKGCNDAVQMARISGTLPRNDAALKQPNSPPGLGLGNTGSSYPYNEYILMYLTRNTLILESRPGSRGFERPVGSLKSALRRYGRVHDSRLCSHVQYTTTMSRSHQPNSAAEAN